MKRLLILAILALPAILFANGIVPRIKDFYIKQEALSFSLYDYQNGGYGTFPLRFQEINGRYEGIYVTFMADANATQSRKQWFAYYNMEGDRIVEPRTITSGTPREGFGTVAVDPKTGDAFFVWHASYRGQDVLDLHYVMDLYSMDSMPGVTMTSPTILVDNSATPNPEDPTTDAIYQFNWGVVHIGPSPEPHKSRVYVFAHSNGRMRYFPEVAASVIFLAHADFDIVDMHEGNIVWTKKLVPFFNDVNDYKPLNASDKEFVRTYTDYAVSKKDGKIALAGVLTGPADRFNAQFPQHEFGDSDHFVVIDNNYGEFTDDWFVKGFKLSREGDPPRYIDEDGIDHPILTSSVYDGLYDWKMRASSNCNTKTVIIDENGNVKFPVALHNYYMTPNTQDGYFNWMPSMNALAIATYDPKADDLSLYNIFPRTTPRITREIFFPYDSDNDGFIDDQYLIVENNLIYEWFPHFWPYAYAGARTLSTMSRYSQFRLTHDNDGLMAFVWVDGTKAYRFLQLEDDDFAEYGQTSEINIVFSQDSGQTWTEPLVLSGLTHKDELGDLLAYAYPAEKVLRLNDHTVRLYMMYVDDRSYGTSVPSGQEQPGVGSPGANIKFVAIDVYLTNDEQEVTIDKPTLNLAQNYPNPFNPSTTIRFNVPRAGNVKLNVYNIKGQLVKTLLDENRSAGTQTVMWNGVDNNNNNVASGVYFYKLETSGATEMKKMVLMK